MKVRTSTSKTAFRAALESPPDEIAQDEQLMESISKASESDWTVGRDRLLQVLAAKAFLSKPVEAGHVKDSKGAAKEILSNPVFRDPGERQSRNWLSRSLGRIGKWFSDFLERLNPKLQTGSGMTGVNMAGLTSVVWFLLAGELVAVLLFVLIKFRVFKPKRARGSILDEQEEVLTSDEWLIRAKELETDGRLRDAVRCLYLASLVRLDEADILRFVKAETNWEHLARFETNPDRPVELDLRAITQRFDLVWYGFKVNGTTDVSDFRAFYETLLRAIRSTRSL